VLRGLRPRKENTVHLPDESEDLLVLHHKEGGHAVLKPADAAAFPGAPSCIMTYYSMSGAEVWSRHYPVSARQRADELLAYDSWEEQLPDSRLVRQRRHREMLADMRRVLQEIDRDPLPVSREAYCLHTLLEIVSDLVEDQALDS
jgi:hypothetical protein